MKTLTLKNGVSYNLTDASTIYNCMSVVSSFADIDVIAANMTAENLSICTFNGVQFRDIIPVCINAGRDALGGITVNIINRDMTDTEHLEARQAESEAALIELAELIAGLEPAVAEEVEPEEADPEEEGE